MIAFGQRQRVVVLVGLDQTPLRQVSRRANGQNGCAIGGGELWIEESKGLINLLDRRDLPFAAACAAAEEHEQLRIVKADFVDHLAADSPCPTAAGLPRKLRVVVSPAGDIRADADARRFLPEVTPPEAVLAAQVGVAAPRVLVRIIADRNQTAHGGRRHGYAADSNRRSAI